MTFLDYIKEGDASKATALIETALKQKTLHFIKEQRAVVAEATYGDQELTEGKESSFDEFHKAATEAGYVHTPPKEQSKHDKGPAFHQYTHPHGHSMSVSVNRSGHTGPYGAKKKGNVNAYAHAAGKMDDNGGEPSGGFTTAEFLKTHKKAEESLGKK